MTGKYACDSFSESLLKMKISIRILFTVLAVVKIAQRSLKKSKICY